MLHQPVGGLKGDMDYTGCRTIDEMRSSCQFIKSSKSGLNDSQTHNVTITKETPNYRGG